MNPDPGSKPPNLSSPTDRQNQNGAFAVKTRFVAKANHPSASFCHGPATTTVALVYRNLKETER
jgi:hypothetical protein